VISPRLLSLKFAMALLGAIGYANLMAAPQVIACSLTAAAVLGFELPQRVAGLRSGAVSTRQYASGAARVALRCAPEMLCVAGALGVAVLLRLRGDVDDVWLNPQQAQIWEQIKQEWPILCGADTLLNFQAWLRLLALMAVAARAKMDEELPMTGMAAVFMLTAMTARTALATRTSDYRLEGPLALGGDLPIAVELAMLPRLAWLSARAVRQTPVAAAAWVGGVTWFASFHFLNLATNPDADKLFTLAHAMEMFAAFAFMVNTIVAVCGPREKMRGAAAGFMQLVMPCQAALSAYYFMPGVGAFDPHANLVGGGRPFCLLVWANLFQLMAYLCSAAFFVAGCFLFAPESAEAADGPLLVGIADEDEPKATSDVTEDLLEL